MRRLVLGTLAGLALLGASGTHATPARAAQCVTLSYLTLLDQAGSALAASPPQPQAAVTALTQAEGLVPSSASGLAPIINGLAATPPDVAGGRERLGVITSTLSLPPGSTCDDDSRDAIGVLHGVYASPVFADLDQNKQPSLLERIGAAINWVLSHLLGLLGTGGSILLGLIVLAVIAAFVIWRVRGTLGGRLATQPDEPPSTGDDPDHEWRLALAAAQGSDFREAIRRAFRSALLEVAGRRAHLDRAWTTREMLATLSADADLLAVLAPASAAFDSAWYGAAPVGLADWEVARARCEAVRRVARSGAGRPAS